MYLICGTVVVEGMAIRAACYQGDDYDIRTQRTCSSVTGKT